MRNISKAERVNKPWFHKRWASAWHCPEKRQPEGRWFRRYIDHPLVLHTRRAELVNWVAFARGRRKKCSVVQMLRDPTGEVNATKSFLIFGLVGYMIAKRRASNAGSLLSKQNAPMLADLAMAGFRFRDLVAFKLGQGGFTETFSVYAILHVIPGIVTLLFGAGMISGMASEGVTDAPAYLISAGALLIIYGGVRFLLLAAGLGMPTMFAVQMEKSIRNRVEPLGVRTKRNIKEFLKGVGVAFLLITGFFLLFILILALVFILSIFQKPYINGGVICTIGFLMLWTQPWFLRKMLYRIRLRELEALRKGDALFDEFLMKMQEDGPAAGA